MLRRKQVHPSPIPGNPGPAERRHWQSWQVALVWVAGVVGAFVALAVTYLSGWIGVSITIACTDRGLDDCPDGDILRTLSLVLPGLIFLLGLTTAVLTAGRSRWGFVVDCVLMVLGPAAVLLLMAVLEP